MAISTILCPCHQPDLGLLKSDLPKFTLGEFAQLAKTNALLEKLFAKKDTGKRSRTTVTRLALIA